MRLAVDIGIAISALIIINEISWIGRTGLALVITGLAVVLLIYGMVLREITKEK